MVLCDWAIRRLTKDNTSFSITRSFMSNMLYFGCAVAYMDACALFVLICSKL